MNQIQESQNRKVADIIHNFQIKSITKLDTLQSVLFELEHLNTGARMIHIATEDTNNCFAIAFRTTPKDNTGIAHILEHFVLCGSKQYPLRDPFFSMIKRSLKTFMNAFTASDWTMYPFATQNKKDFFNLMSVYLDAALFPLLTEYSFMQEGCRIELADANDLMSPITYKGVVFNEMKGAMSSQSSIMQRGMMRALFPTSTYGNNSGGDPIAIPGLTWDELKQFHKDYYHPSNSWIYTYGNLPLEENLAFISDKLKAFPAKNETDTSVSLEKRIEKPYEYRASYPIQEHELNGKNHQIALGWLFCSIEETDNLFALEILESILLGNSASPLKKKLLESNLGTQLSDATGFESETKDTFFAVGLQGVSEDDLTKVEQLILDTLNEIIENGIDKQLIEAALHQFEISLREVHESSYPTGLNLLLRFFGLWMHEGDFKTCLEFDQLLGILSDKLNEENCFEKLIKKYLIDNPHRVTMILSPDVGYNKKQEKELQNILEEKEKKLTIEDRKTIKDTADHLDQYQNKQEDLSLLPTLELSDITIDEKKIDYLQEQYNQTEIYKFEVATNGISYFSLDFNIAHIIKPDEYPLLNLLSIFLTSVGNKSMRYDEFALKMSNKTGGISVNHGFDLLVKSPQQFTSEISLSGYAINRNVDELFQLLSTTLSQISFHDFERAKNVLKQLTNGLRNSIVQQGHSFAANYAVQHFNNYFQLKEKLSGISFIQFITELDKKSDSELKSLFVRLEELAHKIFSYAPISLVAVSDSKEILNKNEQFQSIIQNYASNPHDEKIDINALANDDAYLNDVLITSSAVAYDAKVFQTALYGDQDCAVLQVLSTLLQSEFLHREIREKGGAYGGIAGYNNISGIFSMLSYRDPNIERTYQAYDTAIQWLSNGEFNEQNVKEAILQVFSKIDSPLSPSNQAFQEFAFKKVGKTLAMRVEHKNNLLRVNKDQIVQTAKKWLTKKSSNAIITGNEKIEENKQFLNQGGFQFFQI